MALSAFHNSVIKYESDYAKEGNIYKIKIHKIVMSEFLLESKINQDKLKK